MKDKHLITAIVIPLLLAMLPVKAQAATVTESGDAGESLNQAQNASAGTALVDSISGLLSGDADLYRLFLTGGQTFSATTLNAETLIDIPINDLLDFPDDLLRDPQLFLFDSEGRGVYGNDDTSFSTQSILPSFSFSPINSGIYYLAIAGSGYNPISASGRIFPNDPTDEVYGATGAGGNSSLSGFEGTSSASGRYTIALTGVQNDPEAVPEPISVLGTLTFGAWLANSRRKNKKTSNKSAS